MGLFGKKSTSREKDEVKTVVHKAVSGVPQAAAHAIIKPRITEKAAHLSEAGVYVFEIQKDTTKYDVRDAIKALYNVTPRRVNIVKKVPRHYMSRVRGRDVMVHGLKKAYVYLKKGDRIELI